MSCSSAHILASPTQPYLLSRPFFFFNDTATTEIYTLSLHDALPISVTVIWSSSDPTGTNASVNTTGLDRKSTRLNSSHSQISYAVFCLKKKKDNPTESQCVQAA